LVTITDENNVKLIKQDTADDKKQWNTPCRATVGKESQIPTLSKRTARSFGNLTGEGSASVKGYNGSARKRHQNKVVNNGCYDTTKSWLVGVSRTKEPNELRQEEGQA